MQLGLDVASGIAISAVLVLFLSALIVAALLALNDGEPSGSAPSSSAQQDSDSQLNELRTLDELKSLINEVQGAARVFLLLDPI